MSFSVSPLYFMFITHTHRHLLSSFCFRFSHNPKRVSHMHTHKSLFCTLCLLMTVIDVIKPPLNLHLVGVSSTTLTSKPSHDGFG